MSSHPRHIRRSHLLALPKVLSAIHPAPEQMQEARVFAAWMRSLPKRMTDKAKPVRFQKGILFVHTTSSAWSQELHMMHDDIVDKLRSRLPDVSIYAVKFRVGEQPQLPAALLPPVPKPSRIAADRLPEDLARALAHVADDNIRQSIASAARMSLGANPDVRVRKPIS